MADLPKPKRRKRLECAANQVLVKAVWDFMSANGYDSEGKAVEFLLRETLTNRGHLPAPRI